MNNIIYSDGVCINNGTENPVASWSYLVTDSDKKVTHANTGRVTGLQNNDRAELIAFINALQYVHNNPNIEFTMYVDFEPLYKYCNGKFQPETNLDLYLQIDSLIGFCGNRIKVEKVKASKTQNSFIAYLKKLLNHS